jgi:uncharacterized circularly permuted ATP-grasp superfamily protein
MRSERAPGADGRAFGEIQRLRAERPEPRALDPARGLDEVHDRRGDVRPQYRGVWETYRALGKARVRRSLKKSLEAFRGDNALHPMPRILTQEEYDFLRRGVEQRGTALRMFLQDHYSGRRSYTAIIPKETIDKIIRRNHEEGYEGLISPENISFPYGPDLMRARDGRFYVIEDNPGFIGGPGDIMKGREVLFDLQPEYKADLDPIDDPADYHRTLLERARERANPPGGRIVMYAVPPYADKEDERLKKIMRDLGVEILTPYTRHRLIANDEGVFIRRAGGSEEHPILDRVGFLFLNGEHKWIDASHPVTEDAYLFYEAQGHLDDERIEPAAKKRIEEALGALDPATGKPNREKLEAALNASTFINEIPMVMRQSVSGLMKAILENKVATNYTPGIDFIGDKEFKGYVDDLVRFYLKEEPLIRGIPVQRFVRRRADGKLELSEAAMRHLLGEDQYQNYVFKVVDGRGGTGVFIGPKLSKDELPSLEERIRDAPESYIAEPYRPLSEIDGHIVDLRLLAAVDGEKVVVSPTPWSRGVPLGGDGKVNISAHGKEFGVVVVESPAAKPDVGSKRKMPGILRRWLGNRSRA